MGDGVREAWALATDLSDRFTPRFAAGLEEARAALAAAKQGVAVAVIGAVPVDPIGLALEIQKESSATALVLLADASELPRLLDRGACHGIHQFLARLPSKEAWRATLAVAADAFAAKDERRRWIEGALTPLANSFIEALSVAAPGLFSRTLRIQRRVQAAAQTRPFEEAWVANLAAALGQLGVLSLPLDLAEKLNHGEPLSPTEQQLVDTIPARSAKAVAHVPAFAPVTQALEKQVSAPGPGVPFAARILRIATDLDLLEARGLPTHVAIAKLRARPERYDVELLPLVFDGAPMVVRKIRADQLEHGMVLSEDLRTTSGFLVAARGHLISASLLDRIRAFAKKQPLRQPVEICAPDASAAPTGPLRAVG